jgi:hypothetical protein
MQLENLRIRPKVHKQFDEDIQYSLCFVRDLNTSECFKLVEMTYRGIQVESRITFERNASIDMIESCIESLVEANFFVNYHFRREPRCNEKIGSDYENTHF